MWGVYDKVMGGNRGRLAKLCVWGEDEGRGGDFGDIASEENVFNHCIVKGYTARPMDAGLRPKVGTRCMDAVNDSMAAAVSEFRAWLIVHV